MSAKNYTKDHTLEEIVAQFENTKRVNIYARLYYFKNKGDTENYEKLQTAYEMFLNKMWEGTGRKYGKNFGVATSGKGEFCRKYHKKEYSMWSMLVRRTHCPILQEREPSYIGSSMSDEFLDFQKFMLWAAQQVGSFQEGYHLDKDLLVKGNKHYSRETCVFLPQEINVVLVRKIKKEGQLPQGVRKTRAGNYSARIIIDGKEAHLGTSSTPEGAGELYKIAKKKEIIKLAEKYKDVIDIKAYQALLDYEM